MSVFINGSALGLCVHGCVCCGGIESTQRCRAGSGKKREAQTETEGGRNAVLEPRVLYSTEAPQGGLADSTAVISRSCGTAMVLSLGNTVESLGNVKPNAQAFPRPSKAESLGRARVRWGQRGEPTRSRRHSPIMLCQRLAVNLTRCLTALSLRFLICLEDEVRYH